MRKERVMTQKGKCQSRWVYGFLKSIRCSWTFVRRGGDNTMERQWMVKVQKNGRKRSPTGPKCVDLYFLRRRRPPWTWIFFWTRGSTCEERKATYLFEANESVSQTDRRLWLFPEQSLFWDFVVGLTEETTPFLVSLNRYELPVVLCEV